MRKKGGCFSLLQTHGSARTRIPFAGEEIRRDPEHNLGYYVSWRCTVPRGIYASVLLTWASALLVDISAAI